MQQPDYKIITLFKKKKQILPLKKMFVQGIEALIEHGLLGIRDSNQDERLIEGNECKYRFVWWKEQNST